MEEVPTLADKNLIQVPYNWTPRAYQLPIWNYFEKGGKRAVAVWHRRAGKDATALNLTVTASFKRPGIYWHLLPTYNQGRKIVWDGRTKEGRRFLDHWPAPSIKSINGTEMKMELENGSMWQVVGTDNVDRLVGANPIGCVFSEYSLQDPRAWDYIRPILVENGGWALFIYTPRGRNHGYDLYEMARKNHRWFSQRLTIDDTGVLTDETIQEEREAGMPEEMVQQEFYCSFDAGLVGSYYGPLMAKALEEGRIGDIPYEPRLEVDTAWDLGMHDSTAIWFCQVWPDGKIALIDYYEGQGEGLQHYIKVMREKDYVYGRHYAPHDIEVRDFSTGRTRRDTAAGFGLKFEVVPRLPRQDGIEAVRSFLPRCWFNYAKTNRGVEALRQYKKRWDEKKKSFSDEPDHDWTSHAADAFRQLALKYKERKFKKVKLPREADSSFSLLG